MIKCDPKAFMKCPIRMKHCKTEAEAYFCDGSDCHKFNQKILSTPKTNADRIRAMSDEKLAKLFMDFAVKCYDDCGVSAEIITTDYVMEWLKQPAEGEINNV